MDILIKTIVSIVFIGIISFQLLVVYKLSVSIYDLWKKPINIKLTLKNIISTATESKVNIIAVKNENAIYQKGDEVALVSGDVKIFTDGIAIDEIYNAQKLNFSEPIEFRGVVYLLVQKGSISYNEFTDKGHRVYVIKNLVFKKMAE